MPPAATKTDPAQAPPNFPHHPGFGEAGLPSRLGRLSREVTRTLSTATNPDPDPPTHSPSPYAWYWRCSGAALEKKRVSGKHPERYPRSGQASLVHDKKKPHPDREGAHKWKSVSNQPPPEASIMSISSVLRAPGKRIMSISCAMGPHHDGSNGFKTKSNGKAAALDFDTMSPCRQPGQHHEHQPVYCPDRPPFRAPKWGFLKPDFGVRRVLRVEQHADVVTAVLLVVVVTGMLV